MGFDLVGFLYKMIGLVLDCRNGPDAGAIDTFLEFSPS